MKRFLWLGLVLCLLAIWAGCGDTFRPVIIPNPPAFPDPRAAHTVVALNYNDDGIHPPTPPNPTTGSIMVVDVSGDTNVGVTNVGLAPVHMVQQTASQVLVVNHSVTDAAADSLTKIVFFGVNISTTSTISLPQNSAPNFVATTESTTAYVSLPNYSPPSVAVVSTQTGAVVATVPVGANPVALAERPDGKKVYVANQGDNSLTVINTIDRTTATLTTGFSAPRWVLARSDNQRVYVLNGDGTLTTLDTTADNANVIQSGLSVGAAGYMVYDVLSNRIYVPSADQLTVLDVSGSLPQVLATVAIPTVAPSARSAQDPCASTATAPLTVVAAAALPDKSRVYAGAYYTDTAGNICPQVTAINTSGNTIKTTIPVPGFPGISPFSPSICTTTPFRLTMAAGGDSSRVYLASCDAGNVNIINTFSDTYLLNLPAPGSSRAPIPPNTQPPPQNPVFLLAGP